MKVAIYAKVSTTIGLSPSTHICVSEGVVVREKGVRIGDNVA